MLSVSDAVAQRRSARAYLDRPVSDVLLREVLQKALRAPSNSNIQPWLVHVVNGDATRRVTAATSSRSTFPPQFDSEVYPFYPVPTPPAQEARRFECGEAQYGARGIARDDAHARLAYVYGNHQFFGAPAGMFLFTDPSAGPSQWADLGIFLQTVLLLLTEAGLDCVPQISWNRFHALVKAELGVPETMLLYCGVSIGYADPNDPINAIRTGRAPLDELVVFHEA